MLARTHALSHKKKKRHKHYVTVLRPMCARTYALSHKKKKRRKHNLPPTLPPSLPPINSPSHSLTHPRGVCVCVFSRALSLTNTHAPVEIRCSVLFILFFFNFFLRRWSIRCSVIRIIFHKCVCVCVCVCMYVCVCVFCRRRWSTRCSVPLRNFSRAVRKNLELRAR
jgi:hypothetical protein